MSTINLAAAKPFFDTVARHYDQRFPPKQYSSEEITLLHGIAADDSSVSFVPETMSEWYRRVDATDLLSSQHLTDPDVIMARFDDITNMQTDAFVYLADMGEKPQYIIHDWLMYPQLASIAAHKSQLDSLIFRKVYCEASDEQRNEIIQTMEAACDGLNPNFFNDDRRIYRIQGIAAFIFRSTTVKGIVFIAVIITAQIIFGRAVEKVSKLFVIHVLPRWEDLLKTHSYIYIIEKVDKLYGVVKSRNAWFTVKPERKSYVTIGSMIAARALIVISPKFPLFARVSFKLLRIFTITMRIILPKEYLYSFYNWGSPWFIRHALATFKVFSGTEYKTENAIREKFKLQPAYCEKGLKAHALWMRLMRKGRPEEYLISIGYFSPSAA